MRILCVFGEHNYGDPSRGQGPEFSSFIPSLTALGHEVAFFDSLDRSRFQNFSELNRALLDTVDRHEPDVVMSVLLHYEIWLETLEFLSQRVVTVNWTTDDSWRYESFSRFVAPSVNAITTTYLDAYRKYVRDGFDNAFLTQWAANPTKLREPLPASSCKYDVTFVGEAHGERKRFVQDLRNLGIQIQCFGYGWENGPVTSTEMLDIFRQSRLSLNFANSSRRGGSLVRNYQLKARTFEVPGAGGCLVTELAPELENYYRPGDEVIIFDSENLAAVIDYYLAHPDARDEVAWAGFDRTRREHTYAHRFPPILDFACSRGGQLFDGEHQSLPDFSQAHQVTLPLKIVKLLLIGCLIPFLGKAKARRGARKIVFELSWRLLGRKAYVASGWPGRMFYEES